MYKIVNQILSQKQKSIPRLPKQLTANDIQYLQQAVRNNIGRKLQSSLLKLLLAQAYKQTVNNKCLRQISDIGFQNIHKTQYQLEARFRICGLIIDNFDTDKFDVIKYHITELAINPAMYQPINKFKMDILKAGIQGLKGNYYKAAFGYLIAAKEQLPAISQYQRIQLIEKAITMCFLAQKTQQLHQIICQLYINRSAKKSPCYAFLAKLYTQTSIQQKQIQLITRLLPTKFSKKDSQNISIINKAIFIHNMIPVKKCFQTISLKNLSQFTGIAQQDLLILIQKSYTNKQMQIDQVSGYLYIKSNPLREQQLIKNLFENIEDLGNRVFAKNANTDRK